MTRQWTKPLGTVDNQMMQKKAKRRVSFYTLETPNWSTKAAQVIIASSARFLLSSPRAFHNQMLTSHHPTSPNIVKYSPFSSRRRLITLKFAPGSWRFFFECEILFLCSSRAIENVGQSTHAYNQLLNGIYNKDFNAYFGRKLCGSCIK